MKTPPRPELLEDGLSSPQLYVGGVAQPQQGRYGDGALAILTTTAPASTGEPLLTTVTALSPRGNSAVGRLGGGIAGSSMPGESPARFSAAVVTPFSSFPSGYLPTGGGLPARVLATSETAPGLVTTSTVVTAADFGGALPLVSVDRSPFRGGGTVDRSPFRSDSPPPPPPP
eukprot:Hpha_TRINITY_DN15600_c0_g5::TRINITY_DN15600_c0_g5_i1::g.97781::m.97781